MKSCNVGVINTCVLFQISWGTLAGGTQGTYTIYMYLATPSFRLLFKFDGSCTCNLTFDLYNTSYCRLLLHLIPRDYMYVCDKEWLGASLGLLVCINFGSVR